MVFSVRSSSFAISDISVLAPNCNKHFIILKSVSLSREHALSLSILEFQYMGYSDVKGIMAEGMVISEEDSKLI